MRHGGNAVAYRQAPVAVGRSTRNNFLDLRIAIFGRKHGANADKREFHRDLEIFQIGRAKILRMRIVGLRQSAEEGFDYIVILHLANVAENLIVPAGHRFLWRPEFEFGKVFLEEFCFDAALPNPIRLLVILGPWSVLAVDLDRAAAVESVFFLSEFPVLDDTIFYALPETGEDFARRPKIPTQDTIAQRSGILAPKFVDVLLCEVQLVVV